MANDFFGNEIKSGDVVACLQKGSSTSYHIYGIVLKTSNKTSLVFCPYGECNTLSDARECFCNFYEKHNGNVSKMIEDKTYIKRKDNNGIIKHPNAVPFDVF
jgi:hypothetical protein